MKKLFLSMLVLLVLGSTAFASRTTYKTLRISGAEINSYAIPSGATITSDSVYQAGNIGYGSLLTSVSGNVTISQQVSIDGTNWFTPYTTDGSTLTTAGTIASAVTADRWIILTAKLAPYVRFVYASSGASTITSKYVWQNND